MALNLKTYAREEVRDLPLYVPGKPIEEVQREYGLSEVIKLASNENPWGPSPKASDAMHKAVNHINRYPDGSGYALKSTLAQSFGLSREHFLLGNGSEEIVQMIAKAFFRPGDEVLMGKPSFPRYETVSRMMGAKALEIPMEDGLYPLRTIADHVNKRTRAIFICNPNNPTGTALGERELTDFVQSIPDHIILVFDEAYYEFMEEPFSGIQFLSEGRPLVVLRTFSKAFGLAGIRLGYAISQPELIDAMNRVREPFNANAVALEGALAAWLDQEYLAGIIAKNRAERAFLTAALEKLGARVFRSQTNFLMAFFNKDGKELSQRLLEKGVIVRPGGLFGYPDALRISVGTHEENIKLLRALEELI